jgi:hypothetical protein
MVNQVSFGRRTTPQRQALRVSETVDAGRPSTKPDLAELAVDRSSVPQPQISSPHVDHELHEWKQARKQRYKIPWRQVSLMAALCFGIASLVLPDSVNENLDWLLYGLMAASFYAGVSRRWLS